MFLTFCLIAWYHLMSVWKYFVAFLYLLCAGTFGNTAYVSVILNLINISAIIIIAKVKAYLPQKAAGDIYDMRFYLS